jgi:NADH:ubiquinone oxidoreductase subunit E
MIQGDFVLYEDQKVFCLPRAKISSIAAFYAAFSTAPVTNHKLASLLSLLAHSGYEVL